MRIQFPTVAVLLSSALPISGVGAVVTQSAISTSVPNEIFSANRSRHVLIAQVLLDRSRHSPGIIDGLMGGNTARAIRAFQRAKGMEVDGRISGELLRRLGSNASGDIFQRYKVTAEDVSGPFVDVPSEMEGMAKLARVGFESPLELLSEKFHMSESFLRALNPHAAFDRAGSEILVVSPRRNGLDSDVARIEVDKSSNSVRAYAEGGALLATYPATIGSSSFPSPSGSMTVRAVAPEATYHFNPEGREWGPDEALTIAAGPNNPVGGVWIDLSKEGYGIHGSPDPHLIGKTSSHGCVRLTNWDAEELAKAVRQGTEVEFL